MRRRPGTPPGEVPGRSRGSQEACLDAAKRPEIDSSHALHPVAPLLNQESLEERLAYHFRRPELLAVALTHSSAAGELQPSGQPLGGGGAALGDSNERLEFLGDAVLALAVSESLVSAFPGWSEGQLSKSRARLVNAGSLAEAARRLDLGAHLRLGKG